MVAMHPLSLLLLPLTAASLQSSGADNFTLHYSNISLSQKVIDVHSFPHSADITPIDMVYNNGGFNFVGYRPSIVNNEGFAVFVYVTGTSMSYTSQSALSYTQYMAQRGFVAVSAQYANGVYPLSCGGFTGKAELLWDQSNVNSLLYTICNAESINANCQRGITTAGMSQGAQLASMAAVYNGEQVKGMYLMGGGDQLFVNDRPYVRFSCLAFSALNTQRSRIRSVVGQNDGYFGLNMDGVRTQQNSVSGTHCSAPTTNCLNADGSGWYIVQSDETASGTAPHCYAYLNGECASGQWDANYRNGAGEWSFDSCVDWLISKVP